GLQSNADATLMPPRSAKARRHAVPDNEKQNLSIGPSLLEWLQGNCRPSRPAAFGQMEMEFYVSRCCPEQPQGNDEQSGKALSAGHCKGIFPINLPNPS